MNFPVFPLNYQLITFLCILLKLNGCFCLIFYNENDSQTILLNPNETKLISIISSNKEMEFSLVNAHSQINNITLSYDNLKQRSIKKNRFITGLNVGIVVFFDDGYPKRSYLYLKNENNLKVRVLIQVLQFNGYYPIPGGCNLEFSLTISPFLRLKSTTEFDLTLEYQKASMGSNFRILKNKETNCDFSNNKLTYDVYSYYLKENDYSEKEFMMALKRMSSVDSIETYGTKLENQLYQKPKTRIKIIAYRGKGVVYNIVVSFLNFKIAYTPVVSYDCNLKDSNSCKTYQNWSQTFYFLICGLIGLVISFDGFRILKCQILYFSFLLSSVITFILVSKYPQINLLKMNLMILICALLFSSIWFLIWLKYSPSIKLASILSGIHFGFLLISLILSINFLSIYQIKCSITYGILVVCGFLIIPACSIFIDNKKVWFFSMFYGKQLNIVCCSIFGSYMFIISIEQFISGSLNYIVMNTVNTFIYTDLFFMDLPNFPFQKVDYISLLFWFILVFLSLFLNLFIDCDLFLSKEVLAKIRCFFSSKSFKQVKFLNKPKVKKYEEIETVDNPDEDISKYNELSRSIIGSLDNLDKENEVCNTSFNSNSKFKSSPLIKRNLNSSSTKIDISSPTSSIRSRCSTPKSNQNKLDHLDYQLTPNNLLRNVVIQNARFSSDKNRF